MTVRPLKLLSSMATRELLAAMAARFQQQNGREVITEAAGGLDVARRVEAGEPVDVVVLAAGAIDKLVVSGKLLPDSRVDLVESGIAMAVRAGAAKPAVATEEDVRRAVVEADSLSYSTGPSGQYLEGLFARWEILEKIRDRIVVPPPGVPVGSLVAQGRVALGFQQLSEMMNLKGVSLLGPLPDSIQSMTVFSGAVGASSDAPGTARALLAYMASVEMSALKREHGMSAA